MVYNNGELNKEWTMTVQPQPPASQPNYNLQPFQPPQEGAGQNNEHQSLDEEHSLSTVLSNKAPINQIPTASNELKNTAANASTTKHKIVDLAKTRMFASVQSESLSNTPTSSSAPISRKSAFHKVVQNKIENPIKIIVKKLNEAFSTINFAQNDIKLGAEFGAGKNTLEWVSYHVEKAHDNIMMAFNSIEALTALCTITLPIVRLKESIVKLSDLLLILDSELIDINTEVIDLGMDLSKQQKMSNEHRSLSYDMQQVSIYKNKLAEILPKIEVFKKNIKDCCPVCYISFLH